MTVFEREVLAEIVTQGKIGHPELQKEFGPVVWRDLQELRREGYIVTTPDGRYAPTDKAERYLRGEE